MADIGTGSNTRVILDYETAFKTEPGVSTAVVIPHSTLTCSVDQAPQQSSRLQAGRHSYLPFYGNKTITGTLTGPVCTETIGFILKCFLGEPDSTSVHTFTVQTETPSFLIEKQFTDLGLYYKYNGCKATSLSFTFNNNNELLYNLGFMGASETKGTSSYDADPEVISDELSFNNVDLDTFEEAGASSDIVNELVLNLANNGVAMAYGLSEQGVATYVCEGRCEVTGTISGVFANDSLLLKGRNHTESSLDWTLTKGSNSIQFTIDELQYSQNSPNIDGPGMSTLDLSFIGYYQDSTAGSDIEIVLTNDRSSY